MAEKTVRNYVSTILKKINVDNRTEAAMYWIRQKVPNLRDFFFIVRTFDNYKKSFEQCNIIDR